uniref:Ion transport domain-containing protein n=1 Tax=Echeneis naucrates TaxID=173247 RepID=A0A665W7F1_ECHNA
MGLYFGNGVYLQSSWNILDGLLVFVSLVDILVSIASAGGNRILGILRVLRLLRTLRPLRVISRAPGLKLVVETLITSLRPIGNIVLICCAFFIVFGILGVQDGWVSIMYDGLDAVGVDQQPIRNNNPWMLLFFISFLLIVSFFVLNMFVGVVVENFHNHYMDLFITIIIFTNLLTMKILKYCNYVFTVVFVIEAILKLIAFGLRRFFKESRHATFDNFGMAFLTLFRVSTGDNWNGIMKDTLRECRPQDRHCLTYLPFISPVYFVTFVLTAQFVLVNVVVAVLMKHLEESNKEAQLEEMEEKREREEMRAREEMRVREEANRRLSAASLSGDLGPVGDTPAQVTYASCSCMCRREGGWGRDNNNNESGDDDHIWQVQFEDEGCSHGNLLSMGRMLSLPSDSYTQPLRCSPYSPAGHEAYSGYSYSGTSPIYS